MDAGSNKQESVEVESSSTSSNVDDAAVSLPRKDGCASSASAAPAAAAAVGAGDEEGDAAAPVAPPTSVVVRPYYECVFCKRGFTTAQALGGHMNIHRRGRDRAKPGAAAAAAAAARDTMPTAGVTSTTLVPRNVECYGQHRRLAFSPAAQEPAAATPVASGGGAATVCYRSAPAEASAGVEAVSPPSMGAAPRALSLFDAAAHDHNLQLALAGVGRDGGESRAPEGSEQAGEQPEEEERELDLELRLWRRPRQS